MGLCQLDSIKKSLFPVNQHLLPLKLCYFIVYSVWFSAYPYVALISAQVVNYTQLAIIYACVPVTSIFGPIVTGFIADKIGNYKAVLTATLLLSVAAYLPVWWLESQHRVNFNDTDCTIDDELIASSAFQNDYTFPILLVARLLGFYSFDTTNFLLDACCLTMTRKYGGDFARQKLYTMVSMTIIPMVVGILIDEMSKYKGFTDYSIAFYISTALTIGVCFLILRLEVDVEKNKQSAVNTAKKIIGMIDVDAFFLTEMVVGACWGYHRSFYPIYANVELQVSKTYFGMTSTISGVGSMVVFWVAKTVVEKFGAPTTVITSLGITCLRFLAYYYLENSWFILINESMEGTSGFLSLVAGSYFCGAAAPVGMLASLNGLFSAAVFGAGRGMGLTAGSLLTSAYGIRFTYLVFGVLAGVTSLTYLITYHLLFKKMERARLSELPSAIPKGSQTDERAGKEGSDSKDGGNLPSN